MKTINLKKKENAEKSAGEKIKSVVNKPLYLSMITTFFFCVSFALQVQAEAKTIDRKNRVNEGKQKCVYDSLNKTILDSKFDEVKYSDGKYWVSKGDLKGVYNSIGETVLSCEFEEIEYTDGKYIGHKDGKKIIYDSAGSSIL